MTPLNVLFLCTANSCRSQMAEGLARHLKSGAINAYSAGIYPQQLNPNAVRVMKEVGIDISSQISKRCEDLKDIPFDYVVTVCDNAREQCPVWLGKGKVLHRSFDDPPQVAESAKTEQEALAHYRSVRDEIKEFIEKLPAYFEGK